MSVTRRGNKALEKRYRYLSRERYIGIGTGRRGRSTVCKWSEPGSCDSGGASRCTHYALGHHPYKQGIDTFAQRSNNSFGRYYCIVWYRWGWGDEDSCRVRERWSGNVAPNWQRGSAAEGRVGRVEPDLPQVTSAPRGRVDPSRAELHRNNLIVVADKYTTIGNQAGPTCPRAGEGTRRLNYAPDWHNRTAARHAATIDRNYQCYD